MFARTTRLLHLALALSIASPIAAPIAFASANAPHVEPAVADEPRLPPRAAPARADVRAALAARRAHNLASFRAYRTAGVYPHNMVRPGPLNVWRDPDGHLCAAATILDKDGQHEIVMSTAASTNNIRLLDVTTGPLMDWMLMSGFTVEEIDRIQVPGFMEQRRPIDDHTAEDARLRKDYEATDAALVRQTKASLEVATDRLMDNPALAWQLITPAQ